MSTSDDDRIAYLSGEAVDSLTPRERAELDELRTLLETPATWEEPDAALEERVVSAIADEAHRLRPVESAPAAPAKPETPRPRRRRWWFRRPALAFGGLATATAAIVVAIVLALGSSSPAPLRFAMVVSGTTLAPGAHGSGTLTKMSSGWEIQLSASGLPHLSGSHYYYQAWLKNAAGILVPVGTFNDAQHVILWSGAPVTQFRSFSVTVQPANGNPVPSGRRVLVGTAQPVH